MWNLEEEEEEAEQGMEGRNRGSRHANFHKDEIKYNGPRVRRSWVLALSILTPSTASEDRDKVLRSEKFRSARIRGGRGGGGHASCGMRRSCDRREVLAAF